MSPPVMRSLGPQALELSQGDFVETVNPALPCPRLVFSFLFLSQFLNGKQGTSVRTVCVSVYRHGRTFLS